MERIEYLTEILPDGHLYLPDDIRHHLVHKIKGGMRHYDALK